MVITHSKEGERLGLTHKGIGVVEHYLMARRLMMRNIYFHQKKLALEYFLVQLLSSVAQDINHHVIFSHQKKSRLGNFLSEVNDFNHAIKKTNRKEQVKQAFIEKNYPIYKELCDYDIFSIIASLAKTDSDHPAVQIAKRLHFRQMPKIIRLDQADISKAK